MLGEVSGDPIFTERLELRRTRTEDAAAMFEALKHPETYTYLPRNAPTSVAQVEERFARVMQERAEGRDERWLNWTVWLRETGQPLGTIEATENTDPTVSIGYLFDPCVWGRGYASEAVSAMLAHLADNGALSFEATIDVRNTGSQALVKRLGFRHARTDGVDQIWRRSTTRITIDVTDRTNGVKRTLHMTWETLCDGVAIGTSEQCAVQLDDPSLHAVHARIQPAGHHVMLFFFPDGGALPFERPPTPIPNHYQRIDYRPFDIGHFTIQLNWFSHRKAEHS